ncbi:MAG: right-handed parallel beta-helix repeat-containing protein [Clostridia bacterium]
MKSIIASILVAVMLLTYTACGSTKTPDDTMSATPAQVNSSEPAAAPTPEIIAEPAPNMAAAQEREAFAALVADRKNEIQKSTSNYPTDGIVYYVSNSGDDKNDGLSPETVWRTLDKVNSGAWGWEGKLNTSEFPEFLWASEHPDEQVSLQGGDAVLFERGGLWRGQLQTAEGVTYSAYGEGEKPCFYGSPENGAGAEKWTLVEGTTNIWLFHQPVQQCGMIVCDNDTIALRDYAYYEDGIYYKMASNAVLSWEELEHLPELTPQGISENLHFFCEIPSVNNGEYCWIAGALYLRCDEGNPGKVFSSMEFATGNNAWNEGMARVRNNVTLDNLSFRYGMSGIYVHDSENAVIRNCAVSYVGGMIISAGGGSDISDRPEECSLICSGDAILLGGVNNIAENNYISNTFDYGVTVEAFSGDPNSPYRSGCRVSGNLLESCSGGLLVVDWNAINNKKDAPVFTDITLSDNVVAYSGCSKWAHYDQRFDENWNYIGEGYGCSELDLWINPGCKDILVENNVFGFGYENEYRIALTYVDSDLSWLTAVGNTFLADYGAKFISVNNYGSDANEDQYLRFDADMNLEKTVQEQIKDASCKLTLIK